MKRYILLLMVAYLCSNCEKTITLDLDQHEPRYVIEGLITNHARHHTIRISKTAPFNATTAPEQVSGALVTVSDGLGNQYAFQEDSAGLYRSAIPFAGQLGQTYTLEVAIHGHLFTASEQLPPIATIDSIVYAVNPKEQQAPEEEGRYYDVMLFMDEPQATEDYYLAKFYRNGRIDNDEGESVFYFDDRLLSDRISGLAAPYFYSREDYFRFELYSLSRKAYRYFFELDNNINGDGGMFSGTPANILTNLQGGAVGYFQVSGLAVAELIIE